MALFMCVLRRLVVAPSGRVTVTPRTLVWVDRKGTETPLNAPPRSYTAARISPDGTKIALDIRDQQFDIWTWDIRREAMTRVTFDPSVDMCPVWTLDSKRILWASLRATGIPVIFSQARRWHGHQRSTRIVHDHAGLSDVSLARRKSHYLGERRTNVPGHPGPGLEHAEDHLTHLHSSRRARRRGLAGRKVAGLRVE